MKLAFSICSLTCPPWSFHTFLCLTPLMQSSHLPPFFFSPIFLSLSHYSFLLPLYKPPPPSISVGLSLGTPTVRQENMAQIPLSHIPNTSTKTCERYTINMHFALGTVSKRQMPANASKTDIEALTENKKMRMKKGKTQEDTVLTHVPHIISGHRCLS